MQKSAKHFAEKLNQCLNEIDAPNSSRDRAAILSKLLDIPKQQAWSLVEGHLIPDDTLIKKIATEFDVDAKWLLEP